MERLLSVSQTLAKRRGITKKLGNSLKACEASKRKTEAFVLVAL